MKPKHQKEPRNIQPPPPKVYSIFPQGKLKRKVGSSNRKCLASLETALVFAIVAQKVMILLLSFGLRLRHFVRMLQSLVAKSFSHLSPVFWLVLSGRMSSWDLQWPLSKVSSGQANPRACGQSLVRDSMTSDIAPHFRSCWMNSAYFVTFFNENPVFILCWRKFQSQEFIVFKIFIFTNFWLWRAEKKVWNSRPHFVKLRKKKPGEDFTAAD